MSCSHCKTVFAHLGRSWSLPYASGGGFLLQSDPSRGGSRDFGLGPDVPTWGTVAGRGAGFTVTLEQAGQGAEGSCRFFGLAAGGALPLQSLVGG